MNICMWDYYQRAARAISDRALTEIQNLADWQKARPRLQREFFESMGLKRLPEYRVTAFKDHGEERGCGFMMRKISYQMLPDCWASACVYWPDPMPADRLPAVLYTCGHSTIGTYYGQRHAIMWARRGYVCMVFDTIEQNDNPGDHHGLCKGETPHWISMGYSAAGGELWNSMRALDVLEKMPGVNSDKIGVTGNSGGGAHSFFLAIADERIKAAATSCGVVRPKYLIDRQHLLSHCDCMCYHNLYRRDPIDFAALVAPRPLLFSFAIEDYLFSVELYKELHAGTQKVYRYYGCAEKCALFDYHGGHGYQPESVAKINAWFDEHLSGAKHPPLQLGELELEEKRTSVFNGVPPQPNRLAVLPELLSDAGNVALPKDAADWETIRRTMREKISAELLVNFDRKTSLQLTQHGQWLKGASVYRKYTAEYCENEIWVETLVPEKKATDQVVIGIADSDQHARDVLMCLSGACSHTVVSIVPRFSGFNSCGAQTNLHLRAGAYTGMTPFMLMLEDVLLSMPAILALPELQGKKRLIYGKGEAGVCALYAAILDDNFGGVVLDGIPRSHRRGAYFLNVLKLLDIEHATGLVAPRRVSFVNAAPSLWMKRLYERLGCSDKICLAASVKDALA